VGLDYFATLGMTFIVGHEFTSGGLFDVLGGVFVIRHFVD